MDIRDLMREKVVKKITEMALSAGDGSDMSMLTRSRVIRNDLYEKHKNDPVFEDHGTYKVRVKSSEKETSYHTIDHSKEEVIHQAVFVHRKAGHRNIPFVHHEQIAVDKLKGSLPNNHAADIAHKHMMRSGLPLVSSEIQSDQRHKMWHSIVSKTIQSGAHAYYHDHSGLKKLNDGNKNQYLKKYFGDSFSHDSRNIVVSKHELK